MALPKKSKGWRQITIDGTVYRWRFDANESKGWLTIRLDESGSPNHKIDLPNASDPWINFNDGKKVVWTSITPKNVADIIISSDLRTIFGKDPE